MEIEITGALWQADLCGAQGQDLPSESIGLVYSKCVQYLIGFNPYLNQTVQPISSSWNQAI